MKKDEYDDFFAIKPHIANLILWAMALLMMLTAFLMFIFMPDCRQTSSYNSEVKKLWEDRCENLGVWLLIGDSDTIGTDEEIEERFEMTFGEKFKKDITRFTALSSNGCSNKMTAKDVAEIICEVEHHTDSVRFKREKQGLIRVMKHELMKIKNDVIEYHMKKDYEQK